MTDEPNKNDKFFIIKRIFITPLAKRIAKQRDIDISLLKGSGPNGRILKIDVEKFNDNKSIIFKNG